MCSHTTKLSTSCVLLDYFYKLNLARSNNILVRGVDEDDYSCFRVKFDVNFKPDLWQFNCDSDGK